MGVIMIKDKSALKQLHFVYDVPEEWHMALKKRALEQNMTIKKWVIAAIEEKIQRERELGWE
jgi:predicted HicB family RNase H-like nuclease